MPCAVAAGFAARILRLRASLRVVFRVGALFGDLNSSLSNFTLPTSHFASTPCAFGRHPGAAAVIRPIVHDRAAFGLQFFPRWQPRRSLHCQPHSDLLERQLKFRRALRLFRFGNIHSPGGVSCQDCGGFLPPPIQCSPSLTSSVSAFDRSLLTSSFARRIGSGCR
jgi:hypothetical protein